MDGWTITKVWEIDNKLVVADTIEEAIALIKLFAGEDYSPMNIRAIGNAAYPIDCSALIKERK